MSLRSAVARFFAGQRGPEPSGVKGGGIFAFSIPIAGRVDADQWASLEDLLIRTLRSVLQQTNPDFRVFVAGHERPRRLDEIADARVEFVPVQFPKPVTPKARRRDKWKKRWAIAARFRELGGGYLMYLDADDYVHRDLVDYVLKDDNRTGYYIPRGYALDFRYQNIASIPGAWGKPLNHVCGSSGIIYFRPSDLPKRPFPQQRFGTQRYFMIRNHLSFDEVTLGDRPNAPIPFPAVVYTVNNGLNLSNVLVRAPERQLRLIDGIRQRNIAEQDGIRTDFGIRDM